MKRKHLLISSIMILIMAMTLNAQSIPVNPDLSIEYETCLKELEKTASESTMAKLKETLAWITPEAQYAGIELQLVLCYAFKEIDVTAREAVKEAVVPLLTENDNLKKTNISNVVVSFFAGGIVVFILSQLIW